MTNSYKISNKKNVTLEKFGKLLPVATPKELRVCANKLLRQIEPEVEGFVKTEFLLRIGTRSYRSYRYPYELGDNKRVKEVCAVFNSSPFHWSFDLARDDGRVTKLSHKEGRYDGR